MEKLLIALSLSCLGGCTEDQQAGGYPDFKLNTNLLAGRTQTIAVVRSFFADSATNSARLMDQHTRLNQQLDWLAAQPQQTPTNYDSVIRTPAESLPAKPRETATNSKSLTIPVNVRFYSRKHPDWPPALLPLDSALPLWPRKDGNFIVDDWDYPYPSDFGPQEQVFPKFEVSTNALAGNTQLIALIRDKSGHDTNDLRLLEHHRRVNELFDWLAKQPRQRPSNDYSPPSLNSVNLIQGEPAQSATSHP